MTVATKMNDSTANIKQIITSFQNIITIYEAPDWVKNVTSEDIKIAFKLGLFVEKTMFKLNQQNTTNQFLTTLQKYEKNNYKIRNYTVDFFEKINDQLLMKFFKSRCNENIIDVALRMYTSLYAKERLQVVLKNLILSSGAYEAILEFTISNNQFIDFQNLKYELILEEWSRDYDSGNKDKIISSISNSLSSFKVSQSLPDLLGILALNSQKPVSQLILDQILKKMLDRSILSKSFWISLLKEIDHKYLVEVSMNYNDFLKCLCDFLIYLGGMMEECNSGWVTNPSVSLCPEITYNDLLKLFIFFCQYPLKDYIIERLTQAKICTDSTIWDNFCMNLL